MSFAAVMDARSLAQDCQLLGAVLAATTYGGHSDHWAAADEVANYTWMRTWSRRAQRVARMLQRLEARGWVERERAAWGGYSYRASARIRAALA